MSADGTSQERVYRETFGYRTNAAQVDQVRSDIEQAAERLGLRLEGIDVIPRRRREVKLEITVFGTGRSITALRESLHEITLFSNSPNGGEDIGGMILGEIAGPVLDGAATMTRRGWWELKRHRRGAANQDTSAEQ